MKKFVLSTKSFDTIEDAEKKADSYFRAGQLKQNTRIFEVKKVYNLELKAKKKLKKHKHKWVDIVIIGSCRKQQVTKQCKICGIWTIENRKLTKKQAKAFRGF